MTIIKYAPFTSTAEASFWTKLAELKLEEWKLDETEVEIYGTYSPGSTTYARAGASHAAAAAAAARLRVNHNSFFSLEQPLPSNFSNNEQLYCKGILKLVNTAEAFKRVDKQKLLESVAARQSSRSQDDDDSALSVTFVIVAFLDLKKYTAIYWFGFPADAPKTPVQYLEIDSTATAYQQELNGMVGQKGIQKLEEAVMKMRFKYSDKYNYQCPAYFMIVNLLQRDLKSSLFTSHDDIMFGCRCLPLSVELYESLSEAEKENVVFAFVDPCLAPQNPGWPMRNLVSFLGKRINILRAPILSYRPGIMRRITKEMIANYCYQCERLGFCNSCSHLEEEEDEFVRVDFDRHLDRSVLLVANLDCEWNDCNVVGWELNPRGKAGPRSANLASVMDKSKLAKQSIDLNLKLMRWRLLPNLDTEMLADTKCLLLGAGTLGCGVARTLMGWGVRNITFLDNGKVSYSNPVRQSLFELKDCGSGTSGGSFKAKAAEDALRRIFPGMKSEGIILTIPMPGHSFGGPSDEATAEKDTESLDELIEDHDVIFLLTDTRESRWLPTVIAASKDKLLINAALGLDSWLVMRHGGSPDKHTNERLGCYFCNDVVAPENSMRERTLDQQCTVTRPGLAPIAASMAVEMMVALLHRKDSFNKVVSDAEHGSLGTIPHQIRGSLFSYQIMTPSTPSFECCTACSKKVVNTYDNEGFALVKRACSELDYLDNLTGLAAFRSKAECLDIVAWDEDDDELESGEVPM